MTPERPLGSIGNSGVLILGGATASGKTEFAITLAERYGAEIVGADSRQIYRDMPIGTAAPSAEQRAHVPHHLVGFVDPYERYSAARFVSDAAAAIAGIRARGNRAIVVGGTGFYLRALCGGVTLGMQPDPDVRARIGREARTHPPDVLYELLRLRDRRRAAEIAPSDAYRVVRALEIAYSDRGADAATFDAGAERLPTLRASRIPFVKLAIRSDLGQLVPRIEVRTAAMLQAGLVEEAERIGAAAAASDAVGYRDALAYRSGWLTYPELHRALVRSTRRYAKRQLTWFRGEPDVVWLDAGDVAAADAAAATIGFHAVTK